MTPTATLARAAGIGLMGTFLCVLLEHGVGQAIGGASLYGVHEAGPIAAFYGHPELRTLSWVCAGLLLLFGAFGAAFREYLRTWGATVWADLFVLFVAADLAILLAHFGLAMSMVDLALTGHDEALLAVFGVWSGVYHHVSEWLEMGWLGALAVASWRTGALPRWASGWAGVVTAGLLFNMVARLLHLPEGALMPTYALFSLWMLVTAVALLLGGTSETRRPDGL